MSETTTETKEDVKQLARIWTKEEREKCKIEYGTELIVENGSYEDVCTRQAPNDAFIVKYFHEGKLCFDLTRGSRSGLFDMYYDKFKGELKSIDYGHGNIKPNVWGYTTPEKKKKKRRS